MNQYNLIEKEWIPLRFLDGRSGELGLRDTLLGAKDIAAIEDPSPLVVASLYRFLLAVLYRALEGPCDIDEAKTLFSRGLPGNKIKAYLEKWHDRFWLFDEKYPFGQVPTFEPKIWRTWTVLAAENNADNAKVLFDHVSIEAAGAISPADAVRRILATMTFSVSCGKSELAHTGTAPSATSLMALPVGRNLHDTLIFALVPQKKEIATTDFALWERPVETVDDLKKGVRRAVTGLSDRYTWRTRSIRLVKNEVDEIETLAFASGVDFESDDQIDPMLAYRLDEKKGILPIQFREKGLWRDYDSLMPDASGSAPKVIEHAAWLTKSEIERFPKTILILGQANNKAKIEYWRMERFALPGALAGDRDIRFEIRYLLDRAEKAQSSLWVACRIFAIEILTRSSGRKPPDSDVKNFILQMPVLDRYWSILEAQFHEILRDYTLEKDLDDIRLQWFIAVRDAMHTAWEEHFHSVSLSDAWTIRAYTKAENALGRTFKELEDEIRQLKPEKEER